MNILRSIEHAIAIAQFDQSKDRVRVNLGRGTVREFDHDGSVRISAGNADLAMVARDGIEPPTRGFSVRCSTS